MKHCVSLTLGEDTVHLVDLTTVVPGGQAALQRIPFSIRVLLENVVRKHDGIRVRDEHVSALANWAPHYDEPVEIPFMPYRVLMQDFTGVPAVVDLASLRDAMAEAGGKAGQVNPLVPVELVVDHSVQIDSYGKEDSLRCNVAMEYKRNGERYELLKWAQKNFSNLRIVPPNSGICHQVNLEYLARVIVQEKESDADLIAFPDTLVGTDSHTPMVNGIGVLGWGVGGIEAEAVMLGQPYYMSIPEVVGVRLSGSLREGVTSTDLVLTVTELLRKTGVVGCFVEYFGDGLSELTVPDRATLANMTPEYGATAGYFPIDERTVEFLHKTARPEAAERVERYAARIGLFRTAGEEPTYSRTVDLDLGCVVPSMAGPSRPQDRISVRNFAAKRKEPTGTSPNSELHDGSVVIAAITSCTNTSNPTVMLGAGLLARNAVARGLRVPGHVKTSLAPGSRVVVDYLEAAGLIQPLAALGFQVAAFGCTTCIGNSGPLDEGILSQIRERRLDVAAVLSGNRNFEARIHSDVRSNYLASPMWVVVYALAGRISIDFETECIGTDQDGQPVFLEDIWPDESEIRDCAAKYVQEEFFTDRYASIYDGDEFWHALQNGEGLRFPWRDSSTYVRLPPFFETFGAVPEPVEDLVDARVLLTLGDTVTTDHISPAGAIPPDGPAGQYLQSHGIDPDAFNSFGSRRGNHEVMMRGTFANVRIKNQLVSPKEGGWTRMQPSGELCSVYDAAMAYQVQGTPLIVLAGKEYGTGSSRDWAAKGPALLGVRAVLAESYERIHRSNLIGMGVLPLQFLEGEGWQALGLTGEESFSIQGLDALSPRQVLTVNAKRPDGSELQFNVNVQLNTDVEVEYYRHGGILPYVLRQLLAQ